jgi:Fe-S cluster assembly protein SufD
MTKIIIADNASQNIVENVKSSNPEYQYQVGENSNLTVALLVRDKSDIKMTIDLAGRGAKATVVGFIYSPDQAVNLTTNQHHLSPETTSNLLVKSVLDGKSFFNFTGLIKLEKTAQKTDAYQRNENLLVSRLARAESQPILEILANDVKCTHGAATGMFNQDELWYLKSRGISDSGAKKLIINGFWGKCLDLISDLKIRESVADRVRSWLY